MARETTLWAHSPGYGIPMPTTVRTELEVPWSDGEAAVGWVENLHRQHIHLRELPWQVQRLCSVDRAIEQAGPEGAAGHLYGQILDAEDRVQSSWMDG